MANEFGSSSRQRTTGITQTQKQSTGTTIRGTQQARQTTVGRTDSQINMDIFNAAAAVAAPHLDRLHKTVLQNEMDEGYERGREEGMDAINKNPGFIDSLFGPSASEQGVIQGALYKQGTETSTAAMKSIELDIDQLDEDGYKDKYANILDSQLDGVEDQDIRRSIIDQHSKMMERMGAIHANGRRMKEAKKMSKNYTKTLASQLTLYNTTQTKFPDSDYALADRDDLAWSLKHPTKGMTSEAHENAVLTAISSSLATGDDTILNMTRDNGMWDKFSLEQQESLEDAFNAYKLVNDSDAATARYDLDIAKASGTPDEVRRIATEHNKKYGTSLDVNGLVVEAKHRQDKIMKAAQIEQANYQSYLSGSDTGVKMDSNGNVSQMQFSDLEKSKFFNLEMESIAKAQVRKLREEQLQLNPNAPIDINAPITEGEMAYALQKDPTVIANKIRRSGTVAPIYAQGLKQFMARIPTATTQESIGAIETDLETYITQREVMGVGNFSKHMSASDNSDFVDLNEYINNQGMSASNALAAIRKKKERIASGQAAKVTSDIKNNKTPVDYETLFDPDVVDAKLGKIQKSWMGIPLFKKESENQTEIMDKLKLFFADARGSYENDEDAANAAINRLVNESMDVEVSTWDTDTKTIFDGKALQESLKGSGMELGDFIHGAFQNESTQKALADAGFEATGGLWDTITDTYRVNPMDDSIIITNPGNGSMRINGRDSLGREVFHDVRIPTTQAMADMLPASDLPTLAWQGQALDSVIQASSGFIDLIGDLTDSFATDYANELYDFNTTGNTDPGRNPLVNAAKDLSQRAMDVHRPNMPVHESDVAGQGIIPDRTERLDELNKEAMDEFNDDTSNGGISGEALDTQANTWAEFYNAEHASSSNPKAKLAKMDAMFRRKQKVKVQPYVKTAIKGVIESNVLDAEITNSGINPTELQQALENVTKVETNGGRNNTISSGGAGGILQVIPSSFKDAINRGSVGIGPKAFAYLGKTKAELLAMSNTEIGNYLKNDSKAAALFGTAIYLDKVRTRKRKQQK